MSILRTPDQAFAGVADYDHPVTRVEVDGPGGEPMSVAVVTAGPEDGPAVLLLHGEPTWGYLYRKVVPVLAEAGARVVVPDLPGFGRSDKPSEMGDYSYAALVEWMRQALFDRLDLRDVTLFGQDWGGLIGLRLVAEHPDRFAGVVAANTGLTTGRQTMPDSWLAFRDYMAGAEQITVSHLVDGGTLRALTDHEKTSYDVPFPDASYQAGVRVLPTLVPHTPDDPARADQEAAWESLKRFDKPFVCAWSDSDPITRGSDAMFRDVVPGAQDQPHTTLVGGGHFLQEDVPEGVAGVLLDLLRRTGRLG